MKPLCILIFTLFAFNQLFAETENAFVAGSDSVREPEVKSPEIFRNELKINVLSILWYSAFEAGYEYSLTKDSGIGAYVQILSNAKGITPYFRRYPYSSDNKADGFFLGFCPSLGYIDDHTVAGVGAMLGYKNPIDERLAFEMVCSFSFQPPILFDNQYIEPYYLGITIFMGIRW
jgi:hypothetical protein